MLSCQEVPTTPFAGQKPGTSGLRKKVTEFLAPHYMENFLQCTLWAVGQELAGATLVVGGDGRFGVRQAVDNIIKMAAANEVGKTKSLISININICEKRRNFEFVTTVQ